MSRKMHETWHAAFSGKDSNVAAFAQYAYTDLQL